MPFNYPGTEVYKDGGYVVVWSLEEYNAKLADGWSAEKPAAVEAEPDEPAVSVGDAIRKTRRARSTEDQ